MTIFPSFLDTQSLAGIRLTCFILEQLLEDHMEYNKKSSALFTFRHEHYLLVGELSKVSIEDVMLVLKRLLIVAEHGKCLLSQIYQSCF